MANQKVATLNSIFRVLLMTLIKQQNETKLLGQLPWVACNCTGCDPDWLQVVGCRCRLQAVGQI